MRHRKYNTNKFYRTTVELISAQLFWLKRLNEASAPNSMSLIELLSTPQFSSAFTKSYFGPRNIGPNEVFTCSAITTVTLALLGYTYNFVSATVYTFVSTTLPSPQNSKKKEKGKTTPTKCVINYGEKNLENFIPALNLQPAQGTTSKSFGDQPCQAQTSYPVLIEFRAAEPGIKLTIFHFQGRHYHKANAVVLLSRLLARESGLRWTLLLPNEWVVALSSALSPLSFQFLYVVCMVSLCLSGFSLGPLT